MLTIRADYDSKYNHLLSKEFLDFLLLLEQKFGSEINGLLKARALKATAIESGEDKLQFLEETRAIREDTSWKIAPIPEDLLDRRVEITGPADRKMIINAVNSDAKIFMACFEDALTPTFHNLLDGQLSLYELTRDELEYVSPEGKHYKPKASYPSKDMALVIMRPRGFHLMEKHITSGGMPVHGCLLDFAMHIFHNAKILIQKNSGAYYYLPKIESHLEARLWKEIFAFSEDKLQLKKGKIKATVLIETINAAFEMDEILYELKDYIVGQNAGRWDYIFSYIKRHAHLKEFITPDRAQITMTQPFMDAYCQLLIQTCHKRGAFAMGGMAAFIPVKNNEAANEKALSMVKADKEREARNGHDGTWVAHPALIPVAMSAFDGIMENKNQLNKIPDANIMSTQLLEVPMGEITENGIRNNISVCLQYLANWLNGKGCVPIFNMMEDAATAEISRTQLWQWLHHGAHIAAVPQNASGEVFNEKLYQSMKSKELEKIMEISGDSSLPYTEASSLLDDLVLQPKLEEFLTLGAYEKVVG